METSNSRFQEESSLKCAEAEQLRQCVQELERNLMTSTEEAEFFRQQNLTSEAKLRECDETLLQQQTQIDVSCDVDRLVDVRYDVDRTSAKCSVVAVHKEWMSVSLFR